MFSCCYSAKVQPDVFDPLAGRIDSPRNWKKDSAPLPMTDAERGGHKTVGSAKNTEYKEQVKVVSLTYMDMTCREALKIKPSNDLESRVRKDIGLYSGYENA